MTDYLVANRERIGLRGLMLAILVAAFAFFQVVKVFMVQVIVAATIASLFYPLYQKFSRKLKPSMASLCCCLVIMLGILVPAYAVVHLVAVQAIDMHHSVSPEIKAMLAEGELGMFEGLLGNRWVEMLQLDKVNWPSVMQDVGAKSAAFASAAINKTASSVFGLVTSFFVIFFTMFYFLRDGHALLDRLRYLSPLKDEYEQEIFNQFVLISRATVRGTFLVGLTQGLIGAVTLLIFGVKSWVVWGAVMVVLSIIPMIGPWLVLAPAGLIQLAMGNIWQGIVILVISTVVVSNVDNLLRPRLVGRDAKMHDLLIFFSTLGGIGLFGVMGFIVGPVIAALFLALIDIYGEEYRVELSEAEEEST